MEQRTWVIRIGLAALIGGLCLLGYNLWGPPATAPALKEELIAGILQDRDRAMPAAERFILLPDFNSDAVLDKTTGLVWEKSPDTTTVTWNASRSICVKKEVGGKKGWRLPAPAELRSLIGPFIDSPIPKLPPGHPFLNVQVSSYWSVVPEANVPDYARYVDAFLGNVLSIIPLYTYPVWCVRGPISLDGY
jgi:Protein of unknown function (DUF1566)